MNGTKLKIFPIEFYSDVSITDFLFINVSPSFVKQMVEEAGGTVTRMDGGKFCVFDRSVLVSNGVMHAKVKTCCLLLLTKMIILFICYVPLLFMFRQPAVKK